jgi:hypothetical protein
MLAEPVCSVQKIRSRLNAATNWFFGNPFAGVMRAANLSTFVRGSGEPRAARIY